MNTSKKHEANEYAKAIQKELVEFLQTDIGRLEAEDKERLTLLTSSGYYFIKSGNQWGVYSPEIAWLAGFDVKNDDPSVIATSLGVLYNQHSRASLIPTFEPEVN